MCVLLELEGTNVQTVEQIENKFVELGQQVCIAMYKRFIEDEGFKDEND